jgi:hypothetical protein
MYPQASHEECKTHLTRRWRVIQKEQKELALLRAAKKQVFNN